MTSTTLFPESEMARIEAAQRREADRLRVSDLARRLRASTAARPPR